MGGSVVDLLVYGTNLKNKGTINQHEYLKVHFREESVDKTHRHVTSHFCPSLSLLLHDVIYECSCISPTGYPIINT
jgi:hypothetical protein